MSEYIEREMAIEICETEYQSRLRMLDYCGDTVAWNIGSEIKALPVANVAPVAHGRWITHYRSGTPVAEGYVSTCCDRWNNRKSDYCPNCGAKMDDDTKC